MNIGTDIIKMTAREMMYIKRHYNGKTQRKDCVAEISEEPGQEFWMHSQLEKVTPLKPYRKTQSELSARRNAY